MASFFSKKGYILLFIPFLPKMVMISSKALAGPWATYAESLENYQGLVEIRGPLHSPLQSEVPTGPSESSHPIKNKVSIRIHGGITGLPDVKSWDFVH